MKVKNLLGLILLTLCTLNILSCKDSERYAPITVVPAQEGNSPLLNETTVWIDPFQKEGVSLYIQGGSGSYSIESNPDTDIADYRFNGKNLLTLLPQFDEQSGLMNTGETSMVISDHAGNILTLRIVVSYPQTVYPIKAVGAKIKGNELTQKQLNELRNLIMNASPAKEGGKFVFIYTHRNMTEGKVQIYPNESSKTPLEGIFTQDKNTIDKEGVKIHIELTNQATYDYVLTYLLPENGTDAASAMSLRQNVTDVYQGEYMALKEAYCVLVIPGETK